MDSKAIENFIVLEAIISAKLRTFKKQVLYRFHFIDKQLTKDNRVV
jgi:hypothetical protein